MLKRSRILVGISAIVLLLGSQTASADVQPGQSITHMKTAPGLASALESAGVVFFVQGGATLGLIGDSVAAENSQIVFHIPITSTKSPVKHQGSNIVFFNTNNNSQVQLRNPVIDLAKGIVTATVPQASNQTITVLTVTNAAALKAKSSTDKRTQIRSTTYAGATLSLAPGVAATLNTLLGLPANAISETAAFGSADLTFKKIVKK